MLFPQNVARPLSFTWSNRNHIFLTGSGFPYKLGWKVRESTSASSTTQAGWPSRCLAFWSPESLSSRGVFIFPRKIVSPRGCASHPCGHLISWPPPGQCSSQVGEAGSWMETKIFYAAEVPEDLCVHPRYESPSKFWNFNFESNSI